ncbi:phage shock protein PspD [Entomohabitans teleogrylli]|uniref:phage shock protein PspD n=1 Tax=Entomohabitans teleogrylli TaxID=1384589 RepID=UPI00073D9BEF|nr:phage shock protein PspD [Entomohabitans teleogrylli]
MVVENRFIRTARKAKPAAAMAGRLLIIAALRYGPAGVAGWAVKSVARRPVKWALAVALEPILSRLARRLSRRFQ